MPTGTPYDGCLVEYPTIRVDAFNVPRDRPDLHVDLYLLTHTHTDHTIGLDNPSFSQPILCSSDARHMLLHQERYTDRIAYDHGRTTRKVLPWSHLRVLSGKNALQRELLRPLYLNMPKVVQLNGSQSVTITAIDANHCPGAVMYLIEGARGAVLHTGDMRAEAPFLAELRRNKVLRRYMPPDASVDFRHIHEGSKEMDGVTPVLEAIYLDTACLMGTIDVPTKDDAVAGLTSLIAMYPPHTRFFFNAWCWGYEDILKAVATSFGSRIHVDRYKKGIFAGLTADPSLDAITTTDPFSTRFHACERFDRCECVPATDREVVYVNAVECPTPNWEHWKQQTAQKLSTGQHVPSLIVPLSRHSTLPELQRFVSMFKPNRIVPNTVLPQFGGADWACIPAAFEHCMAPGGADRVRADLRANGFTAWSDAKVAKQHASEALALAKAAISDEYGTFGPFQVTMDNLLAPPSADGAGDGEAEFTTMLKGLFGKATRSDGRGGRKLRTLEHLATFLDPEPAPEQIAETSKLHVQSSSDSDEFLLRQLIWDEYPSEQLLIAKAEEGSQVKEEEEDVKPFASGVVVPQTASPFLTSRIKSSSSTKENSPASQPLRLSQGRTTPSQAAPPEFGSESDPPIDAFSPASSPSRLLFSSTPHPTANPIPSSSLDVFHSSSKEIPSPTRYDSPRRKRSATPAAAIDRLSRKRHKSSLLRLIERCERAKQSSPSQVEIGGSSPSVS